MEMVLPRNQVALEQEEMMYLDGGFYMNHSQVRSMVATLAGSGGVSVSLLSSAIKLNAVWMGAKFGALAGAVGVAVGSAFGVWIGSQAVIIAERLTTAMTHRKGVKWGVGWTWAIIPGITGDVR